MEHSQLQIPTALPPVAETLNVNSAGAAAASRPTVSDKEWKTLLGKLVSLLIRPYTQCVQHLHWSLACVDMMLGGLVIFLYNRLDICGTCVTLWHAVVKDRLRAW